jgi:hypothetical protein
MRDETAKVGKGGCALVIAACDEYMGVFARHALFNRGDVVHSQLYAHGSREVTDAEHEDLGRRMKGVLVHGSGAYVPARAPASRENAVFVEKFSDRPEAHD